MGTEQEYQLPRPEAYYRPTRSRILRKQAERIERWAAGVRWLLLVLYVLYWGWWIFWSLRGDEPFPSPFSHLPTWALHIPRLGSLTLVLGTWFLSPRAARSIAAVLCKHSDRLDLDHESRYGFAVPVEAYLPEEGEDQPGRTGNVPTMRGKLRARLATGLGVGVSLCVALSAPEVVASSSPDATLTAFGSSPGFLPGAVGVIVDGGAYPGRGYPRMAHLRCRVDLRDNQTGEVLNILDIGESVDWSEDWYQITRLEMVGDRDGLEVHSPVGHHRSADDLLPHCPSSPSP